MKSSASLGSGGFGITYLAKDLFLNRNVVIKENFPSSCSYRDPLTGHHRQQRARPGKLHLGLKSFLSEAQTLAELNHPGIVRILSVFEANGTAYFAMENITGLSLDYLGEKLHSTGHRYTEDEAQGPADPACCRFWTTSIPAHLPPYIKPGNTC